MRKNWVRVIAICCAVLVSSSPPMAQVTAANMADALNEKQVLQNELNEAKKLIRELESGKKDIESYVAQLDQKLEDLEWKMSILKEELNNKEVDIQDTQDALVQAQDEVARQYENMKKRIRFLYERGESTYLEMLLSATSLSEFLNVASYILELSAYDRDMMNRYQAALESVENLGTTLESEKAALTAMEADLVKEQEAVALLMDAKRDEIMAYGEDIEETEEHTHMLESEIQAQDEMIAMIRVLEEQRREEERKRKLEEEARLKAIEEAKQRAEEARIKAEEEAKAKAENGESSEVGEETETVIDIPEPLPPAPVVPGYENGRFAWPLPASHRVTSEFGARTSPTPGASSMHQGIDIGAPSGSDIIAAAPGKVVVAAYSSSAGNYVMLDHGKGLYTVYMHCSSIVVSGGQTVETGQVIAKVGSTGVSTGPHLHFGVSLNGAYVSPWGYL